MPTAVVASQPAAIASTSATAPVIVRADPELAVALEALTEAWPRLTAAERATLRRIAEGRKARRPGPTDY